SLKSQTSPQKEKARRKARPPQVIVPCSVFFSCSLFQEYQIATGKAEKFQTLYFPLHNQWKGFDRCPLFLLTTITLRRVRPFDQSRREQNRTPPVPTA